MSDFKCEVVKIDDVIRHPNATSLTICKIRGFNCITSDVEPGVARYKVGDFVVYIPEAAIVPDWLLKKLGFWDEANGVGTLSGSRKNRVKIIKLRGEYSQGIMLGVRPKTGEELSDSINDTKLILGPVPYKDSETECHWPINEGDDVAEFLGITKYEPAIPEQMRGVTGALFGYTKSYDIESLQNFPHTFEEAEDVVVTEKLHGTLCQIGFIRDLPDDKRDICYDCGNGVYAYVTSKGMAKQGFVQKQVEGNKDNIYVKAFNKYFVETGLAKHIAENAMFGSNRLYILGEIMGPGVQSGFTYNKKTPEFRVFDIYDEVLLYLNDQELEETLEEFKLQRVPVLYRGQFSQAKMAELRDGKTVEGNDVHIREGIVIRSSVESKEHIRGLHDGRKQCKFVSPEYLKKSTGEEFN